MSTVYIMVRKEDYNYSAPLAVFDDKLMADIYLTGSRAGYGSEIRMIELELNSLEVRDSI